MKDKTPQLNRQRDSHRITTKTTVQCQLYSSACNIKTVKGVMNNFSNSGYYIETSEQYKPGNILLVKVINYQSNSNFDHEGKQPRSVSLATVKWNNRISSDDIRFGIGLKYLE